MKNFFTKLTQTLTDPLGTAKEKSEAAAYAEETRKKIGELFFFWNNRYEVVAIKPYKVQYNQPEWDWPITR